MTQDYFLGQLRLILVALIAYASGKGWLTPSDQTLIAGILPPLALLIGPFLWSWYAGWGKKFVAHDSVVSPPAYQNVTKALILAALGLSMFAPGSARAADVPWPLAKPVASAPNCSYSASLVNCSGGYILFGVLGDGTSADILGGGLDNSLFQNGAAVMVGGGYQYWMGQVLAGVQVSAGYSFATNNGGLPQKGSRFVGTELVQLGYNFFPNASLGTTTPGQAPALLSVPANFLATTTPYFNLGGCQIRGNSAACFGAGMQTVFAAGWSSALDYLSAPSQNGQPAAQIVSLKILKHF